MWWWACSRRERASPHSPLGLSEARPVHQGQQVPLRWRALATTVLGKSALASRICLQPPAGSAPTPTSGCREPVQ